MLELKKKYNMFLNDKYTKYIVDYQIEDEHIKVISNVGNYRIVKNTKDNIKKINHAIITNKIAIAKKIDEYENTNKERLLVLLLNILLVCGSGAIVPFTFFIGNFFLFVLSIILFGISVISSSSIALNYYVLVKEIRNLKQITGYKKENEFLFKLSDR